MVGSKALSQGLEFVLIRDVTEDLGLGLQQFVGNDAGIAIKYITTSGTSRVAMRGLQYAIDHGYQTVTVPNQAPSLRTTDAIFLKTVIECAEHFPGLTVSGEALDSLLMHLVQRPSSYQVLICPYFYGGFLAGLLAGLVGGVGLMPGVNLGDEIAVFEAAHGSVPKHAQRNKVNPVAIILSGAMMLEHLGASESSRRIVRAVETVLRDGKHLTYDQGGSAGTQEVTEAIVRALD
jgi:isocitrate dehydrogenase (NAD+)